MLEISYGSLSNCSLFLENQSNTAPYNLKSYYFESDCHESKFLGFSFFCWQTLNCLLVKELLSCIPAVHMLYIKKCKMSPSYDSDTNINSCRGWREPPGVWVTLRGGSQLSSTPFINKCHSRHVELLMIFRPLKLVIVTETLIRRRSFLSWNWTFKMNLQVLSGKRSVNS